MEPLLTLSDLQRKSVVEDRLKAIAAQLIAAHRRHRHELVIPYARQAGIATDGQAPHHLFMKAIQVYHPDRLNVVWDRIAQARASSDGSALDSLLQLLRYHPEGVGSPQRRFDRPAEEEGEEEAEEYGVDEDEFGYDDFEEAGDFDAEDGWDPDEGTFYSAIRSVLFGNLDFSPDPADLAKLEGELDLSDFDLHELDGIEYCRSLTALNLSRNNLDNIYCLKDLVKLEALDLAENDLEDADALGGLVNLVELDLSANDIDDVAFLDRLPRLRYVDLTGNPVRTRAVLARLEARGVIVIV